MKSPLLLVAIAAIALASCSTPTPQQTPDPAPETSAVNTAQFQQLIDSIFAAVPNTKGVMLHVEAPDQGVSWTGAVGSAEQASDKKRFVPDSRHPQARYFVPQVLPSRH